MEDMVLEEASVPEIPVEQAPAAPASVAEVKMTKQDKKAAKQQNKLAKRAKKQQDKAQRRADKQQNKAQRRADKQQRKAEKRANKQQKKAEKRASRGKRPPIFLRIMMKTACILLAIVLMVCITATVLLADTQHLTSADGIDQLITALISPLTEPASPQPVRPAPQLSRLSTADTATTGESDENAGQLISLLYDALIRDTEYAETVSLEQLQSFVEASSVISEFMAEKAASYINDFIYDTDNTKITADELMVLLDECAPLIEEEFGVVMNEEEKEELRATLEQQIEESGINEMIGAAWREEMSTVMEQTVGFDLSVIQQSMRVFLSPELLYVGIGICLLLAILMCLLSYYNLPSGVSWVAGSGIAAGAILSLPLMIMQIGPDLLALAIPQLSLLTPILSAFSGIFTMFAPLHYSIFFGSIALLIAAIIWRIIAFSVRKARARAAA